MRVPRVLGLLASAACLLHAQPGRLEPGNLLRNGSFEEGPDPGSYTTFSVGSTDIPGWKVTRATVDYVGHYWPASQGARSIDLDGSPGAGAIQTSFPTKPGRPYRLSFDLSGNSECGDAVKKVRVVAGNRTREFSFDTAGRAPGTGWVRQSVDFVAQQPVTTLEFTSLDEAGSYCGPILDNVAAVAAGAAVGEVGTLSGGWLDADGTTHLVEQSGSALSWTVEGVPGVFRGEIQGRNFEVSLQVSANASGVLTGFDQIYGIVSLDGLSIWTREFLHGGLVAETTLARFSTSPKDKPGKLLIRVQKPSTLAGRPILAQVVVTTRDGVVVRADREYRVDLKVDAREVQPGVLSSPRVVVEAGRPSAPFTITADRPGEIRVSAHSDPPLAETSRSVYACGPGAIRSVELSSGGNQGLADGKTPISFAVKLTDGDGHLTTDLKANTVSIQRQGVGAVDRDSVELPVDQCIAELMIESAQPGSATVSAKHGPESANAEFFFSLPLSVLLFGLIAAGAVGGNLIRIAADYSRRRRWPRRRIVIDASAAVLAGIAVFLAYYYGLLQLVPRLTGGTGLGFLLGLVGGYLGPAAVERISGVALPGDKKVA